MVAAINAPAHNFYDIGQTGRFREDGRIIEGRRQIVRGVARQHNERLAGLTQFPRDRSHVSPSRLTSRTATSHLGSSLSAFGTDVASPTTS
jgi:hypothetical protein